MICNRSVPVDTVLPHTPAAGAKIVEELHETEYSEPLSAVEDPERHHWLFSQHVRDVNPEEWGAQ